LIGKKKGEKMHEELMIDSGNVTLENSKLFVSFPSLARDERISEIRELGFRDTEKTSVSSNNPQNLLDMDKIKLILTNEKSLMGIE
jgi:FlaA1/EpsC-like NDP-sugar epimerase